MYQCNDTWKRRSVKIMWEEKGNVGILELSWDRKITTIFNN